MRLAQRDEWGEPDLSSLTADERRRAMLACRSAQTRGREDYWLCLENQIALMKGLPGGGEASIPSQERSSSNRVLRVQTLLSQLGYDPGPLDGILGPRTREAIKAFQRDRGGPISGEVDEALVAQLDRTLARRQREKRLPPPPAIPRATRRGASHVTREYLPAMLPPAAGKALEASEVYRRVQSSVFVMYAASSPEALRRKYGVAQGSAVAVSPRHLLTSCHTLEGRRHVVVAQGKATLPAQIVRGDQRYDRCVLEVGPASLDPVKGVRRFSDLAVGEKVYTVGAPIGLDRTLGEGIISGLREAKGSRLIQFSAPISRGSSGGGLFDSKGNLIGITTFLLQEAQNLNFAVAAEQFWE